MRTTHDVINSFYSSASHPILSHTIESILRNFRNREYGHTSLEVTGPTLFGRSISLFAPSPSILMGHFLPLTPFHSNQNKAFVAQDGSIIAWHKSAWHPSHPGPGDLSCFGLKGTNNYQYLWQQKSIYTS